MKRTIFHPLLLCLFLAINPQTSTAADCCERSVVLPPPVLDNNQSDANDDLARAMDKVNRVTTDPSGIKLSGYVDAGYVYNFTNGGQHLMTQGYAPDSKAKGDFNLNAVMLTLSKDLTPENKLQAGFRIDLMIGEDMGGHHGNSGDSNSFCLHNAYVETRLPVGNGLDIKLGQMCSILGFESPDRPANINITKGLNGIVDPGTSPGILASYPATENLSLLLGANNGSNLSSHPGLDTANDGYAFVGGLKLHNDSRNAETQLAVQYAPWGDNSYGRAGQQDNTALTGINWWGSWIPRHTNNKLLLAANVSYWNAQNYGTPAAPSSTNILTTGLYGKYLVTNILNLGGRIEYAHTDDGKVICGTGRTRDLYTFTLTAGCHLAENLLLRAEYRYDLGNGLGHDNAMNFINSAQTVALEAVYTF
jgi:hypothetical protein